MRCLNCHQDGISLSVEICPQCGVYLPSLMRDVLPIGTILKGGSYRLDYPLGRGGFGITYKAMHIPLEQPVAIKEFYPQEHAIRDPTSGKLQSLTTHQEAYQRGLQRFAREGRILAQLNHPNVIRVQDFFEERGTGYLVMEMIPGRSLQKEMEAQPGKRLPRQRVKSIMESLVGALEAVHQQQVYHLDLSPDNVLLMPEGRVVLVDFGAAKQGLGSQSTQAFKMDYAPLEVIAGQDVGAESDIFELGMILYEMLVGKRPPSALTRLNNDKWKPVSLEAPWNSLVESALRLTKEERPKDVRKWWPSRLKPINSPVIIEVAKQFIQKTSVYLSKQEWVELFIFFIGFIFAWKMDIQNKLPDLIVIFSLFFCPFIGFSFSKRFHSNWGGKLFLYYLLFHGITFTVYILNYQGLINLFYSANFWTGLLLAMTNIIYKIIKL